MRITLLSMPGVRFHHGVSRAVALFAGVAVKVALDETGTRCNRFEAHVWKTFSQHATRSQCLCPVLWSDPKGRVLVMPAAAPLRCPQYLTVRRQAAQVWWGYEYGGPSFPWEHKARDWGVLDGRIVAVDYAEPALFPLNEFEAAKWAFPG